jgi:hypothetical protein
VAERGTTKRNSRIPDELWDPALAKAARMADDGYLGDNGRFSVADVLRAALRVYNAETDAETAERLGLKSMLAEAGQ